MQRHKLTGWSIVFIIWTAVGGINGLASLGTVGTTWSQHMADYPSLQTAVLGFELATGAGILAWLYAAWLLYQRQPCTLKSVQVSLLVGASLRTIGCWSIILLGGLPAATVQRMIPTQLVITCLIVLFTVAWYRYLARSERIREIYAAS
jgi:hypothetical protein